MDWLPEPQPDVLRQLEPEYRHLKQGSEWYRIYASAGDYPSQWNEFRTYGPTESRFDHQPEPESERNTEGVLYCAKTMQTCVAETFQNLCMVDGHAGEPRLVHFSLSRQVPVLDLSQLWPTRAGASQLLSCGSKEICRAWAREIYSIYGKYQSHGVPIEPVEGILYRSSMHGGDETLVLFERAKDSIVRKLSDFSLRDPMVFDRLAQCATDLGYPLSADAF